MNTGQAGIRLLHYFESCCLKAYPDPGTGGHPWTVGWGETGAGVTPGLVVTQSWADTRLQHRLSTEFEPIINSKVKAVITQNQFDALISFVYNTGAYNFSSSTLLKKINRSDFIGAAQEFLRWNRSQGNIILGLTRRRTAEKLVFSGVEVEEAINQASQIES